MSGTDGFRAWWTPPGAPAPGPAADALPAGPEDGVRIVPAAPSPGSVWALARALRGAREALLERPTRELARALARAAGRLADPADPLHREALALLPATAGLSAPMAAEVLRGMAAGWTEQALLALLDAEFGGPEALDGFVVRPGEAGRSDRARALGVPLSVHVGAGTVPGVAVTSAVRALLVRSAALVKPGRGDVVLPVLFARALADVDADLAACLAVIYWPHPGPEGEAGTPVPATGAASASGGAAPSLSGPEAEAVSAADVVVVYGGDETVQRVRARAPATTRVVAYHHRVSFAVVLSEALDSPPGPAAACARAVATFDQRGCVSPQCVFVEADFERAAVFAEALCDALALEEAARPRGPLPPAAASELHQARGAAELRAAAGEPVRVLPETVEAWTVVVDEAPPELVGLSERFVRVVPVEGPDQVVGRLRPLARHLQTVAVAGSPARRDALAGRLGAIGASRVTTLERAPWPPAWWHHDGFGPLEVLVRWTDLEG